MHLVARLITRAPRLPLPKDRSRRCRQPSCLPRLHQYRPQPPKCQRPWSQPPAAPVTPTKAAQQPAAPASVPVHASHPGAQDHDVTTSSRPVVPLPAELLGAGILAAGLVALLKKLDNVRSGRRRFGPHDTRQRSGDEARAELAARVGSNDTALLTVDRGLRLFGSLVRQEGLAVPEVLAVELTLDSLVVLFEGVPPPQPPSPWSPGPMACPGCSTGLYPYLRVMRWPPSRPS